MFHPLKTTNNIATVVCRMLGKSYGSVYNEAHFGQGHGPIWLDDLDCHGDELSILECERRAHGHNCGHHEDLSVSCS